MNKILNPKKDRFGFYLVNGFKTYSKVEALEIATATNHPVKWIFNDLEFSSHDWTKEPTESLPELYAARARQIRESYDHVVIFYSGGADSGNVVNSFVDNGVPFEEIATYNYWKADPRKDTYFHGEQTKVSYPRIKELQDRGIKFLHRPIDLSDIAYDIFTDDYWSTNRAYYANGHWGMTHLAKSYIRERVDDYKKIIESGKKLVFVWGSEKPRITYKQSTDQYFFRFVDNIDNGISTRQLLLSREEEHDELFYYNPNCAKLLCKQGHTIMNFFRQHKQMEVEQLYTETKLPDINFMFDNSVTDDGLFYRNLLNWLIYPKFDFQMFTLGKPWSAVYSPRDEVWSKDIVFSSQINNLAGHLSSLDKKWWRDPNDINKGLTHIMSRPYALC